MSFGAKLFSKSSFRFIATFAFFVLVFGLLVVTPVLSAPELVIDRPEYSDVILVLEGDRGDWRYERGRELLQQGYAQQIVLDANAAFKKYGTFPTDLASNFVTRTAPGHSSVCPIVGQSTDAESREVVPCLARCNPRSVLLVTSDFHTRRALSIFRKRLPQYHWSVASAEDPDFSDPQKSGYRERAKIAVQEWQKYVWWKLVDQRKSSP